MKSFLISALLAAVSAEAGYTCTNPATPWTDASASITDAPADAAKCGASCKALAEADLTMDWCCAATTTAAGTDAAANPAAFACALWKQAVVAGTPGEIKVAKAAEGLITYDAWSWAAGVATADMAAADAAADSAKMISSAIATIAAIAMITY